MNGLKIAIVVVLCLLIKGIQMDAAQNFLKKHELEVSMKEKKIPGVSMVIIENAAVALHLELGVKNSQASDPVDSETLFEVASLSKPVFAYGILKFFYFLYEINHAPFLN